MKIVVFGSRSIKSYPLVESIIETSGYARKITELVSGCAVGVDTLAEMWAQGKGIEIKPFPVTKADYKEFGKLAPKRRNGEMARYADAGIAIWDGKSPGTEDMINKMKFYCKPVHLVKIEPDDI